MGTSDAPSPETDLAGERYVIGRGGMADVYRGEDRVLHRTVALKMMRHHADVRDRERFAAEARLLARLNHRGLVPVLDVGSAGDRAYLVMELVDGPSLADCCRGVAMDPQRVAAIGGELADTLAYVHRSGVVHRDVKPSNVLLDRSGRVRLTDFGIAKVLSDTSSLTGTGMAIGTAAYLAPEQVRGERVTAAADVYSLGLVLLEALTGERAYTGAPAEAAIARLSTPPSVPAHVPEAWRTLLGEMTRLDADQRPTPEDAARRLRGMASDLDASSATTAILSEVTGTRVLPQEPTTRPLTQATIAEREPAAPREAAPEPRTGLWQRLSGRRVLVFIAVAIAAVLLLASGIWLASLSSDERPNVSEVPADTPSDLREPLQDLHDAVEEP